MERILITGSLSYFGSMLSTYLIQQGYDCVGLDAGFFKDELLYASKDAKYSLKDVRDMKETDLRGFDVVVHLAGISNDPVEKLDASSIYDPTRYYSLKLARYCKKLGIRFIFASSCSVYGIGSSEYLTEESETHPQTYYSLNKLQIEQDLNAMSDQKFSPIALRFATIFGLSPRMRFDLVINMFIGMVLASGKIVLNSDGKAWRPNIHILDACKAVSCAIKLKYDREKLLVLNVGANENNLQVIEIAKAILNLVPGSKLKFLFENPDLDGDGLIHDRKIKQGTDTRTYKVSFEKLKREIPSFKCEWSVVNGVKDMLSGLNKIHFNSNVFKRRGFYRLQYLEDLHEKGKISDDLRWISLESKNA